MDAQADAQANGSPGFVFCGRLASDQAEISAGHQHLKPLPGKSRGNKKERGREKKYRPAACDS